MVESEAVSIVRRRGDLIIAETEHGFVCANAGVDRSNAEPGTMILLPEDPDRSAHRIRVASKAAPYLRSIVLNLARDHNRRGLVSLRHREALTPEQTAAAPEDVIVLTEDQDEVVEALRSLPARQRDCLVLRFYLERRNTEVTGG